MDPQNYDPSAPKRRYDKIKDFQPHKDFIVRKYNSGARHKEIMESLRAEKGIIVDAHHLKRYLREWGASGKNLTKRRKVYIRQEIQNRQSEGKYRHGVRLQKSGRELSSFEIEKILGASPRGFERTKASPGDILLYTPAPNPSSPTDDEDEENWVVVGDDYVEVSADNLPENSDESAGDLFTYIEFDAPADEEDGLDETERQMRHLPDVLFEAVISSLSGVLNNQPPREGGSYLGLTECAEILKSDYHGWINDWRLQASDFIMGVDKISTESGIFLEEAIAKQEKIYEIHMEREAFPYAIWEELLYEDRTVPVSVREELRILELQKFVKKLLEKYIVPMSEVIDRIKKSNANTWAFDLRSIMLNISTTITKYGYYHILTALSLSILGNTVVHVCQAGTEETMDLWNMTLEAYDALGMSDHEAALQVRRSIAETTYRSSQGYRAGVLLQQQIYEIMQKKHGKQEVRTIFMGSRLAHMLLTPGAPDMPLRMQLAKALLSDMNYHVPQNDTENIIPYHLERCFRSFAGTLVAAAKVDATVQLLTKAVAFCQDMRMTDTRRRLLHAEVCFQTGSVFQRNREHKNSIEYLLVPFHIFKDTLGIDVSFTTSILLKITKIMRERGPVIYLQPTFQKILELMEQKGQSQSDNYVILLEAWMHGQVDNEELVEVIQLRGERINEFLGTSEGFSPLVGSYGRLLGL
ncbi:hypothetical protein H072_8760 [Dactylellina haptotyla CBS 200.50]|uniref:Clr5 domain-containing protein n=1 Tax=Dactylellina haptotyla (strain CBS 200.50) TaxID=1284197 RepID=S8A401_DACHA|nr:hypothetical protein H072_8760 [Dactylellina haptotyla CBS 200.50]